MIFALAGNQNCGKTTLFNQLTGSNQHVGNFPGVTVDQKSGPVRGQKDCTVVDLPGIYSLRPYTAEEIVTRDFILKNKPDGIINIVDATNLERNLYLTLQLLTLRVPTVLALNMMDELTGNGGSIDTDRLSQQLGVPVIPICAASGDGVEALIEAAVRTAQARQLPSVVDFCAPGPVHRCIHAVCHQIEDHAQRAGLSVRFAATRAGTVSRGERLFLFQVRSIRTAAKTKTPITSTKTIENMIPKKSKPNPKPILTTIAFALRKHPFTVIRCRNAAVCASERRSPADSRSRPHHKSGNAKKPPHKFPYCTVLCTAIAQSRRFPRHRRGKLV